MAYLEPYISNSAQGKLNLKGSEVSFAWKNNVVSPDFPSKITSGDVIGSTDFLGWENPKITIDGWFDGISDTTFFSTLKEFAKSTGGDTVIYDPIFFTDGTQLIQINDMTFQRNVGDNIAKTGSDFVKGSLVRYTINATLTE